VGSTTMSRDEVRKTRLEEARRAAEVLGGDYHWAGLDDFGIHCCPEQLAAVADIVRECAPDVVITHSPQCYMLDHEETSRIARMACFVAGVPLYKTKAPAAGKGVPALFYTDTIEGKDIFGGRVEPEFWMDVSSAFSVRQKALACHASQREWLKAHHGIDEYMLANERMARQYGSECGVEFAEGFRQHLGHGYPQDNVLASALRSHFLPNPRYRSGKRN